MTVIIRAVLLSGAAIFLLAALMSLAGLPVSAFVFGLLWVFFGGIGLWIAFYAFREVRNARDWPTVPGRILERGLGKPMVGPGRYYVPHAKYAYSVAGKDYVNDQVYLIRGTGHLAGRARQLVDSLPDPVPVHYDPREPARSYLLVNTLGTAWIAALFGAGALLGGLLQLLVELVGR